jgi:predicted AlkP superfamily phosphohydrolase/phosphomutase
MLETLVIGLDCLSPDLVHRWREDLPTFDQLATKGRSGHLATTHPPITVPAWRAIFSGRDPGELGVYGFRNRPNYQTRTLSVANSRSFQADPIWVEWSRRGESSAVLNVPGTYPCQGKATWEIGCLLTPDESTAWCHPPSFAAELSPSLPEGKYPFDIDDYRRKDAHELERTVTAQTKLRFAIMRKLLLEKEPSHCIFVDLGCDRMHHRFWDKALLTDCAQGTSEIATQLRHFYQLLDQELAATLALADLERTRVLVLSDHGAVACHGGFHLNHWLENIGWLRRKPQFSAASAFDHEMIDWTATRAWAEGGYYGRIFLNILGREPGGIMAPAEYEKTRSMLTHELEKVRCPDSKKPMLVERPEEIYHAVRGAAPDLMVYDPDLHWRFLAGFSAEGGIWSTTDEGLDRANHSWHGFFACHDPKGNYPTLQDGVLDYRLVTPWLLGESLPQNPSEKTPSPQKEPPRLEPSAAVEQRLRDLGYLG